VPLHTESPEAQWLAANYASEARPGAPYAGQWVVVHGEGIIYGHESPSEVAAYVMASYENPADVLVARLISGPLG
jgi:hypothetical protein